MLINVSQQLKDPIGSTRNYKVSEMIDFAGGRVGPGVEIRCDSLSHGSGADGG